MMLRFPRPADDHDAWFAQRYDQLLQWACRITGDDREQAEDLVHDVFVHFMVTRPDLASLDNVDGYLYMSLRNLHLSNVRRAARRQETVLSCGGFDLLDYDSLHRSLRAWEEQRAVGLQEHFQDQLRQIWRYAQLRKRAAKTASVLILRFFHGYYPNEIAQVLRVSRDTVDQLLRLARKEARLFLADPDPFVPAAAAAAQADAEAEAWPVDAWLPVPDLPIALREAALRSDPRGTCVTDARVVALYETRAKDSVPTGTVAHVVSCARCLDRVNRFLGLPVLADRHPLDSLGNDRDPKPPRGGGAARRPALRRGLDVARQRLEDVLSHKPQELRVAVNGLIAGGQQVTSARSRQTLRVTDQPFHFLEVFSERDVRLLSVNVEAPPRGPASLVQRVDLSDDRRLEVRIDFSGASPLVQVLYLDPALLDAPDVSHRRPSVAPPQERPSVRSRVRRLLSRIAGRRTGIAPWRWPVTRGGAFTSAVVATVLAALLINQLGRPVLSAAELLEKSSVAETAWRADRTLALHRSLRLAVRSSATGETTRRRVEIWHHGATGVKVRRAYDDRNQLIAGEWTDASGSRVFYRSGAATLGEPLFLEREAWRSEPSAAEFQQFAGDLDRAVVTREGGRLRVSLDHSATASTSTLLSASLMLRDDWRATEQRVTLRRASETTELTWAEEEWTTRPAQSVPAETFAIDATFAARTASAAAPAVPATAIVPPATASQALDVLAALRRIDADLGEEVRVQRANGRIDVSGVVASAQRQAQIRAVLGDLARHPAIRVRIDTVAEVHARARRRPTPATPALVQGDNAERDPVEGDAAQRGTAARNAAVATPERDPQPIVMGPQQMASHADVRRHFLAAGVSAADADDDVVRLANRVMQQANRLRVHAWALRSLLAQVSAAEVEGLDDHGRRRWRAIVAEHGRIFARDADALRTLLAPVFPTGAAAREIAASDDRLQDDTAIRQTSARFVDAAAAVDQMLDAAFTIPTAASRTATAPLDPSRFWPAFARAASLAASLEHAAPPPASLDQ